MKCEDTNCFGNKDGACAILVAEAKRGKICKFKKTAEQNAAQCAACIERLKRLGKYDLLLKYHGIKKPRKEA